MVFLEDIARHVHHVVGIEVGKGQTGVAQVVFDGILVLVVGTIGGDAAFVVVYRL